MQTILIIDDDAAIGNLEQEVSERAGYAVQHAYSGTEALLLLKLSRPYLILLDLMLAFLPLFLDLAAFYAKSPDRHDWAVALSVMNMDVNLVEILSLFASALLVSAGMMWFKLTQKKEGAQAPTNPRGRLENQAVVHGDAKTPSLYNILQNIVNFKQGKMKTKTEPITGLSLHGSTCLSAKTLSTLLTVYWVTQQMSTRIQTKKPNRGLTLHGSTCLSPQTLIGSEKSITE